VIVVVCPRPQCSISWKIFTGKTVSFWPPEGLNLTLPHRHGHSHALKKCLFHDIIPISDQTFLREKIFNISKHFSPGRGP
jgi:hypothetical protein